MARVREHTLPLTAGREGLAPVIIFFFLVLDAGVVHLGIVLKGKHARRAERSSVTMTDNGEANMV